MKKFLAILMSGLLSFFMFGCSDEKKEVSNQTTVDINTMRYVTKSVAEVQDNNYALKSAFKDNEYYYYMYYLGRIENVPLQENVEAWGYSGGDYEKTLEVSVTTTEIIESCVTNATENCVSWSETESVSVEAGIKNDYCEASIKAGYSNTWGGSSKSTWEQGILNATHFSETRKDGFAIRFNEKYKHGYYRFILMGDIDVFTTIIYDIQAEEFYYENISSIVAQAYVLDYSPTKDFQSGSNELLEFQCPNKEEFIEPEVNFGLRVDLDITEGETFKTISAIKNSEINLPVPQKEGYDFLGWFDSNDKKYENKITLEDQDVKLIARWERKTVVHENSKQRIIDDGGYYGLKRAEFDELNLSSLSIFFNANYKFEFLFTVEIQEIHDGYQEFFLYQNKGDDKYDFNVNTGIGAIIGGAAEYLIQSMYETQAVKLGLVASKTIEHHSGNLSAAPGNYDFKIEVSGELCKDNMYIRYDASGNDEDSWYCNNIKVVVNVIDVVE